MHTGPNCAKGETYHDVSRLSKLMSGQDLNEVTFESLKVKTRSEHKRVKRKIGYEAAVSKRMDDPALAMKRLRLESDGRGDLSQEQSHSANGGKGGRETSVQMSTD